jgi:hypothetical protein
LNATESRSHCGPSGLPIVEGKHVGRFVVAGDSGRRIPRAAAIRLLPAGRFDSPRLGYRDVSGASNSRPLIAALIPPGIVTTHTVFCLRTALPAERQHFLCGLFNSFVVNAVTRLLMGGHVTTGLVEDLPVPPWRADDRQRLIALLAQELSERPDDPTAAAILEAHVARMYELDADAFGAVLQSFPLVPVEERQQAMAAFQRLARRS